MNAAFLNKEFQPIEIPAEVNAQFTSESLHGFAEGLNLDEADAPKQTRAPLNPSWSKCTSVRKDIINLGGEPREVIIYEIPKKIITYDKNAQGKKTTVNLCGQSEEAIEIYTTETLMEFI